MILKVSLNSNHSLIDCHGQGDLENQHSLGLSRALRELRFLIQNIYAVPPPLSHSNFDSQLLGYSPDWSSQW